MLTTTILALLATSPQSPPPPTSALMNMPLAVMDGVMTDEIMLSEAGLAPVPLSDSDDRMVLADIVQLPPGFAISSFSRGTGAMFSSMSSTGYVYPSVSMDGWSFIMVSVSGSGWATDSAYYAEETAPNGNINGDVFAHILDGSDAWFASAQVGVTHKLRDGDEIGYAPLADMDGFLPGYSGTAPYVSDAEAQLGDGLKFFFTVKHVGLTGGYGDIPDEWGPLGSSKWKRPSTIFVVSHDGVQWADDPQVAYTSGALGIDQWSEVCALSVMDPEFDGAPGPETGMEVLLSTRDTQMTRKIWVVGSWTHPISGQARSYRGPLRTAAGGIFAEDVLRITNPWQQYVEAVCGDDPGDDAATSWHHRLQIERTAFIDPLSTGNTNLDFSVHQVKQQGLTSNGTRYLATLRGFVSNSDVFAVLEWRNPAGAVPLTYVMRTGNLTQGDLQSREFTIPWIGGGGEEIIMQWKVYGMASQLLGESQECRMFVR